MQGLVALSFWSMVAVATSGIAGRYLYRQIPHSSAGDELSLAEVEKLDQELARQLMDEVGLDADAIRAARRRGGARYRRPTVAGRHGLRVSLDSLALRAPSAPFPARLSGGRSALCAAGSSSWRAHKVRLHRRILLWQRVRELFHYWHVFHKPFAVVMYLFMVVHIGVAWMTGYAGIGH